MDFEDFIARSRELRARLDKQYVRRLDELGHKLKEFKHVFKLSYIALHAKVPLSYLSWLVHNSEHRLGMSEEAVIRIANFVQTLEEGWNSRTISRTPRA